MSPGQREPVRAALELLGVRRLVLGIQDPSFPSDPGDDTGRGAPGSQAGFRFLGFAEQLGFDGLQLGPQGLTAPGNPSPYDSCAFSRDPLSISLARLASDEWSDLLPRDALRALVAARPDAARTRVPHARVERGHGQALALAVSRYAGLVRGEQPAGRALAPRFARFRRQHAEWLLRDAADAQRQEGVSAEHYALVQWIAHEQHARFRQEAGRLGLRLYGDLSIGLSPRDARACRDFLLPGYRLGAPPSRTNPEGQAWDHPVLDPDRYGEAGRTGPALRFFDARVEKLLSEFDGLRIDHPHGLVCPWVYRADAEEPLRSVQDGARLFSSPDLPDHPDLARFAIAARAQLHPDPGHPRHADDWVMQLEPGQVDRYALLFDRLVEAVRQKGRGADELVCEVLSTLPYPLRRVLERHGLGRFRITQKADLADPRNVYRSENAAPEDWIMFGNHDTEPVWAMLERWRSRGELESRALRAAGQIVSEPRERPAMTARLLQEPGLLAHALFAELFASPAEHVMIFFTDLFGIDLPYNRPGEVSPENWSLRLPQDYADDYQRKRARGAALDLPLALALALRTRGADLGPEASALRAALEARSVALQRGAAA